MRNCGFEGVMGGKLRKASREYYPALHAELQRWCWEGHADGWNVFDVAMGSSGETEDMPIADKTPRVHDLDFEVGDFELPKVAAG
jgi:hypothetical protein